MSQENDEFVRLANAERRLCEEAGPALVAVVRGIEAQCGLSIAEVRVTFNALDRPDGATVANCTIVCAHPSDNAKGHDTQSEVRLNGTPSGSTMLATGCGDRSHETIMGPR